jgi:hypothetical protein
MSEQQVEEVLGQGGECWLGAMKWPERAGSPRQYNGEGYSIIVWYDDSGRVCSKADFNWGYQWTWEIPLRYKIRSALGWHHRSASE